MKPILFFSKLCVLSTILLLNSSSNDLFSQDLRWRALPTRPPTVNSRFEDVYFINENTGWVIAIDAKVYKTTNGGFTWMSQTVPPQSLPRTISFINANTGWIGLLDSIGVTSMLLQTTNGGTNWTYYNNFDGPRPRGLCGMRVINNSTVVVVGKVRGPAFFLKTTNSGQNWTSKDMSSYTYSLIDCWFFNPDSGFAVGGSDTTPVSKPRIIFTSDGGDTWVVRATGSTQSEWGWKLSFPTRDTGYVSIQNNNDTGSVRFFKTNDAGETWTEKLLLDTNYFEQGIGFINSRTGWVGGDFFISTTYGTTDGGETWNPSTYMRTLNKIRFVNDTLGFAAGYSIYKYSSDTTVGIMQTSNEIPAEYSLGQNFPNPFNPDTKINYSLTKTVYVKLTLYDIMGRKIEELIDGVQDPGSYSYIFTSAKLAAGVYFYSLQTEDFFQTKKMVLMK